jgi:hypothetical protein
MPQGIHHVQLLYANKKLKQKKKKKRIDVLAWDSDLLIVEGFSKT